jgi:hypothetical protein
MSLILSKHLPRTLVKLEHMIYETLRVSKALVSQTRVGAFMLMLLLLALPYPAYVSEG